jgi:hypothetical protein
MAQVPIAFQTKMLARFNATRLAKAQWRSEGRKIAELSGSDIRSLANAYLLIHPEVVEDARKVVEGWLAVANIRSRAQKPEH